MKSFPTPALARLRLRRFTMQDADCLAELRNVACDAERIASHDQPFGLGTTENFILSTAHDAETDCSISFAIEHLVEVCLMGEVRLNLSDSTLSYWLGAKFRGKGYMVEAVQRMAAYARRELHVQAMVADVVRENLASRRVLEQSGFRFQYIHSNDLHPSLRHVTLLRYKLDL